MYVWLFTELTMVALGHMSDRNGKLTEAGWRIYVSVDKITIGSDNGLSSGRHQAITRASAGIFLIGPLGTNFSEILIEIRTFSFKKRRLKMSSRKCRPSCLGFNVLTAFCCWPKDVLSGRLSFSLTGNEVQKINRQQSAAGYDSQKLFHTHLISASGKPNEYCRLYIKGYFVDMLCITWGELLRGNNVFL